MADGSVSAKEAARKRLEERRKRAAELAENLDKDPLGDGYATGGKKVGDPEPEMHITQVARGVSVNWLAQVFSMHPKDVTRRLKECPPIVRRRQTGQSIYDVAVAAEYLVKPRFNVEEYMRTMKIEELPTRLQEGFWAAALKRQKWEENAGRLWRTEQVVALYSETFLMITNTMRMWVDDLDAVTLVTPEQRKALEDAVTGLQKQISKSIQDLQRKTPPQIVELAPPPTTTPEPRYEEEPEDDDIDADISAVV